MILSLNLAKRVLYLFAAVAVVAAGVAYWQMQDHLSPSSVNAKPILEVEEFHIENRAAVLAATRELLDRGENPEEFFVQVEAPNKKSTIVLEVWHQDAFSSWNRSVEGNPGGKCRTMNFDKSSGMITRSRLWK